MGSCFRICIIAFITTLAAGRVHAQWDSAPKTAEDASTMLGSGINLGNMLDAPNEGEWGAKFHDEYAKIIHDAGFRHVRLPVKWSAHALRKPPYRIEKSLVDRVWHILKVCRDNELRVVLNVHHFDEIHDAPSEHSDHLIGMWKQISEQFSGIDGSVYFELLNEPHGKLTTAEWNEIFPKVLAEVRKHHPLRPVIIGASQWNSYDKLTELKLPEDDRMLIGTFHYYLPFPFTHQGAEFMGAQMPPKGRRYPAKDDEPATIERHFAQAAEWSKANNRPLYLGEFGCYHEADMADRAVWTRQIVSLAKQHHFSTAYWEFCSGFGAWDPQQKKWRTELLTALQNDSN